MVELDATARALAARSPGHPDPTITDPAPPPQPTTFILDPYPYPYPYPAGSTPHPVNFSLEKLKHATDVNVAACADTTTTTDQHM